MVTHFFLAIRLIEKYYYSLYFIDDDTRTERLSDSHSSERAKLGLVLLELC